MTFTNDNNGVLYIKNGTITGNLTVDTKNATVTNEATVKGNTTINNVSKNTFINKGTLNTVEITDSDGGSFNNIGVISGRVTIKSLSDTSEPMILKGEFKSCISITGNRKQQIKLEGKVTDIILESKDVILTLSETAKVVNPLIINELATLISTKSIKAQIKKDIEVTVKSTEKSKGKVEKGTGEVLEYKIEKSIYSFNTQLNKTQYTVDENITLEGILFKENMGVGKVDIALKITDKDGNLVSVEQVGTDKDGKFKCTFNLPEEIEEGTYIVTIKANTPVNEVLEEKLVIVAKK